MNATILVTQSHRHTHTHTHTNKQTNKQALFTTSPHTTTFTGHPISVH